LLFDGKSSESEFLLQASSTLAGRVGTGNIVRVATAIALRTRSSILMWMVVFWSTAFVEVTLAQIYKEKHLGEFRGGPAFYIERDGVKWFAVLFAVVSIIGRLYSAFKRTSVADGIQNAFEIDTWKSGIVVSLNLVLLYLVG
jgi:AGCS family alanine or glycine:cation symporter